MNTLAIVQARCSSTRLPGKVLKPILGEAMLYRQIERLRYCQEIDTLVVATSLENCDDPLEDLCNSKGIEVYRGDLKNVLDRFYKVSLKYHADNIVRLTGDCPLTDPFLVDRVIRLHKKSQVDYTSNVRPASFSDGLDVEVFTFVSLEKAWKYSTTKRELEHVVPYIIDHPEIFSRENLVNKEDLSGLRWTVDEVEDFKFVTEIYKGLYKEGAVFTIEEILVFLNNNPQLASLNIKFQRNEGSNQ